MTLFLSFSSNLLCSFIIILYYIVFKKKTVESSDDSDVIIESEFIKPLKQGNGETSYDLQFLGGFFYILVG
jgi:hypothetical protein